MAYPVLVKVREGRPIHVEGNAEHPLYRGKTSLHATADLLGLYDPDRLRTPLLDHRPAAWKAAIAQLARALKDATNQGKGIALVTPAVLSPTRKALLARLAEALPSLRHFPWEPAADQQDRQAQRELLGEIRLPAVSLRQGRNHCLAGSRFSRNPGRYGFRHCRLRVHAPTDFRCRRHESPLRS